MSQIQDAVMELAKLGSLPASAACDIARLQAVQEIMRRIKRPISNDDARVLIGLFGPDDCFGLAWALLHLIETAPDWPLADCLDQPHNEWIDRLKKRAVSQ
ncbi:MAG TPA: hypothetical protein VH743_02575 [Beijerinckiaceae bacterium]|jgi:hypothetical protein